MMEYRKQLPQVKEAIQAAIRQGRDVLPEPVKKQHWIVGHTSPAAWRSVEHWYTQLREYDPDVAQVLNDLKLLSEAEACLRSVLTAPEPGRMPDLTLRKRRHVNI